MKPPISTVRLSKRSGLLAQNGLSDFPLFCASLMTLMLFGCEMESETQQNVGPVPEISSPEIQTYPQLDPDTNDIDRPPESAPVAAVSLLNETDDYSASGEIQFVQEPDGLRISGEITGLSPGEHGFHVHEIGDCSAPDAESAGDHFAPRANPHGSPDNVAGVHHAGDLGNIVADEKGHAIFDIFTAEMTLLDGQKSILGKSVIVHAERDDLTTQPSGNSGEPAGCGLIVQLQPDMDSN